MVNDSTTTKEKIPKEISQEIIKKIFGNLLKAVGIMFYFIILNLAYSTMKHERLIGDIEVFASTFLVIGIILLERAYKKDNNSIAISAIEFLVLALHSLSIMYVITLFQYDFRFYLLTSSYAFSIYYVLKSIVLYTKGRRDYLNSLSDISEIVKKDEPIKKEAKKRKLDQETQKKENIEKEKQKKKTGNATSKTKKQELKEDSAEIKKNSKTKRKTKTEGEVVPEKKKRGRPKKEVIKND